MFGSANREHPYPSQNGPLPDYLARSFQTDLGTKFLSDPIPRKISVLFVYRRERLKQ